MQDNPGFTLFTNRDLMKRIYACHIFTITKGENLVDFAAAKGNDIALNLLFEDGYKGTENAVYDAACNDHASTLEILLKAGYKGTYDALKHVIFYGQNSTILAKILLNHGCDYRYNTEENLLDFVASCGHDSILRLLIKNGYKDTKNAVDGTAVNAAAANGHNSTLELLFKHGYKGTAKAVDRAANFCHDSTLELLFKHGYKGTEKAVEAAAHSLTAPSSTVELLINHGHTVTKRAIKLFSRYTFFKDIKERLYYNRTFKLLLKKNLKRKRIKYENMLNEICLW